MEDPTAVPHLDPTHFDPAPGGFTSNSAVRGINAQAPTAPVPLPLREAYTVRPEVATESPVIDEAKLISDLERFHLPENHAFRQLYRTLTPAEAALSRGIKDQAFVLLGLIEMVPQGRDRSLAKTHLEDAVMRAVRGITG